MHKLKGFFQHNFFASESFKLTGPFFKNKTWLPVNNKNR